MLPGARALSPRSFTAHLACLGPHLPSGWKLGLNFQERGWQVPQVPLVGSSGPSVPGPHSLVLCLGLLWSLHSVPSPLQGPWLLPLEISLRVTSASCPAVVRFWAPPPPTEASPQFLPLGSWVGNT